MASNRIAGTLTFLIGGVPYETTGSGSYMGSASKREGIATNDPNNPVVGYKETLIVPYIEVELATTPDLNSQTLAAIDGATIVAELANGNTFTLMNAWCCGELVVETTDGKVKAKFEGKSSLEE